MHLDKILCSLEGITFQTPESLQEQIEDFELLFHRKSEQAERYGSISKELRRQFGGGSDGFHCFIEELLNNSKFESDGKYQRRSEAALNAFDLLRLAEHYQPPKIQFRPRRIDGETIFYAKFVEDPLEFIFNSAFNRTEPKAVCTKNKEPHSLASYLDAADPFTHYLQVSGENDSSFLEAIICECEGKETLLVEGVYGVVEEEKREKSFEYLYSCLTAYAHKQKKSISFNLHFNPASQHIPMQFVNFVGRGEEFYLFEDSRKNPKRMDKSVARHKKNISALKEPIKLLEVIERNFTDPKEVLDIFTNQKRYSDTWWESSGKDEWNNREGEAYCMEIGFKELKKMYRVPLPRIEWGVGLILLAALVGVGENYFSGDDSIECASANMKGLTLHCVDDEGERQFYLDELDNLHRDGDVFKASVKGVKYQITPINEGEAGELHSAAGFRRLIDENLQRFWDAGGKLRDKFCRQPPPSRKLSIPELSEYTMGCTENSAVSFRTLDLGIILEEEGLKEEADTIMGIIAQRAYSTKNADEVLSAAGFFKDENIYGLLKMSKQSGQNTNELVALLGQLSEWKNSQLRGKVIALAHYYVGSGQFTGGVVDMEQGIIDPNFGRGYIVLSDLVKASEFLKPVGLAKYIALAEKLADHPYAAHIFEDLNQIGKDGTSTRSEPRNKMGRKFFLHLIETVDKYAAVEKVGDKFSGRIGKIVSGMRHISDDVIGQGNNFYKVLGYAMLLQEECVFQRLTNLKTEKEVNDYVVKAIEAAKEDDSILRLGDVSWVYEKGLCVRE